MGRLHQKASDIAFHYQFPIDSMYFSNIRVFPVQIEQSVRTFTNGSVPLCYYTIVS